MRQIAIIVLVLSVFLSLYGKKTADGLRSKALAGNQQSCLELGNEYFFGKNRPVNLTLAVYWYRKAASSPGIPDAIFNLGICYLKGWGIKESRQEAFIYLQKAAKMGNKNAKFHLAQLYFSGVKEEENEDLSIKKEILPNVEKTIDLLLSLDKENFPGSKELLVHLLYSKNEYKKQYAVLIRKSILEIVNKESTTSKNLILAAEILAKGIGGEIDLPSSVKYLSRAAAMKDATAIGLYAQSLEEGLGITSNKKQALRLYKIAAAKQDPLSMVRLGQYYLFEINDVSQIDKALELFQKAAKQNYGPAYSELGFCYSSGIGVEKNLEKSFTYYQQGARLNDPKSILKLGDAYFNGIGTHKDLKTALYWYRQACLLNNVEGMKKYGKILLKSSDYKLQQLGLSYLQKASQLGDSEAITILNEELK